MNQRSLCAERKRKSDGGVGGDGVGGEQPLLSDQHQLLDASNEHGQDALLAPVIASGERGALVGGGGGSLSLSDKRSAETMAMAAETAVQPDLKSTKQMEVDPEPADNTSAEAMAKQLEEAKQEKQKQKKARADQREADNRQGQTDFKNVQAQLPGGIPQGLLTGEVRAYGEVHLIKVNFIVQAVKLPSYKCKLAGAWCWMLQNIFGETYTNCVILNFASIQPQHAVVAFNPYMNVWTICPASGDGKCTVSVNGTVVHFDNPAIIVGGDRIVLGNIHMFFTTALQEKQ